MQMNSVLDYYPCGAYELTKDGEISRKNLVKNMSQQGAGDRSLEQLYKKGYIEGFENYNSWMDWRKILVLLLIIILFVITKKKCIYII